VPYLSAYLPLKDADNVPVGMLFVGREKLEILQAAGRSIELTLLLAPSYFYFQFSRHFLLLNTFQDRLNNYDKNILLIEDDPFVQRMYKRMFAHQNYALLFASDGKEGLELAQRRKPNLILLDILMPGLSGLEVLERLKQEEATKNIPVLILSNLAGEDTIADAKDWELKNIW